jgi:hypothetical protein
MGLAGVRRTEDGLHMGGETGVQAVHGQDVCAARGRLQGESGRSGDYGRRAERERDPGLRRTDYQAVSFSAGERATALIFRGFP